MMYAIHLSVRNGANYAFQRYGKAFDEGLLHIVGDGTEPISSSVNYRHDPPRLDIWLVPPGWLPCVPATGEQ